VKYKSPITCHSKDMANVKVFTDRHTVQKLYAPDLSIWGHKNQYHIKVLACLSHNFHATSFQYTHTYCEEQCLPCVVTWTAHTQTEVSSVAWSRK
jgi:hypothetical protein